MYFWKIDLLKKDLLKKPLSEKESFKYLFATLVLYSLGMIPFLEKNIWDVYAAILTTIISAVGIYYIYKCNNGANGKNFLQKYLSIGWVIAIRWTVLVMFPLMMVYFIGMELYAGVPDHTTATDMMFFSVLYMSYYWILGKHMKEIAR